MELKKLPVGRKNLSADNFETPLKNFWPRKFPSFCTPPLWRAVGLLSENQITEFLESCWKTFDTRRSQKNIQLSGDWRIRDLRAYGLRQEEEDNDPLAARRCKICQFWEHSLWKCSYGHVEPGELNFIAEVKYECADCTIWNQQQLKLVGGAAVFEPTNHLERSKECAVVQEYLQNKNKQANAASYNRKIQQAILLFWWRAKLSSCIQTH